MSGSGSLIERFSALSDPRRAAKALYPLPEMVLLLLCATLAERLAGAIGDLLFAYRAGQRVHVAAVSGASPHLARSLKLRQRHVVHFYAGLIAQAVPEAEGRTELAMPPRSA